jgi:hypothetical protein
VKGALLDSLSLRGLEVAPSQVWGAVRLVPLIRRQPPGDLRLARRRYDEAAMVVSLDGKELVGPGIKYISYVPHGLVVEWSDDGTPVASFGANLAARDGKRFGSAVRVTHRMAKREDRRRLRLLPLHLAMEGFLALHFGGPDIAWSEYSRRAISRGLDPRFESAVAGRSIRGLEDALRLFEIHEGQVGVLVFVAEALASAMVVSHPDDYRELHRTLLEDFYGELMFHYGLHGDAVQMQAELAGERLQSLDDLDRAVDDMRRQWATFHEHMAAGILARPIQAERVYRCGPFQLQRFSTALDVREENHIGEAIVRANGTLEYLRTFRLSGAQARRAFLLSRLAEHSWNLAATARALGQSQDELIERLEKAGFGYLLAEHVVRAARRRRRR